MPAAPGRLLASGRSADVYDLGDGTVLRRYRTDRDCTHEARLMIRLGAEGVPVPTVHWAHGRDIVMDLVAGPTMVDDLVAHPWRVVRHARRLARLQFDLNRREAPHHSPLAVDGADGDRVVHLDLHPMNIILAADGPTIIDWTNGGRGDPSFDAAMTYVLMASYEPSGLLERIGRRLMVTAFVRERGRAVVEAGLVHALRHRLADRNTTPGERRNLERLLDRASPDRVRA